MFILRAIQYPVSIPLSIASLHLCREASNNLSVSLYLVVNRSSSISEQFSSVKKLYEVEKIVNRVKDAGERRDGSEPQVRMAQPFWRVGEMC